MYFFYVLYSLKDHRLYKGFTSDIGSRFIKHAAGGNLSTQHRRPFVLIYVEAYVSKAEALRRERWVKSPEGGSSLRTLLVERGILLENGQLALSNLSAG